MAKRFFNMKLMCIFASSFLYAASVHFLWLWWGAFFFAVPLFYVAYTYDLSWKDGYVWGLCTIFLHMSGIIWALACMSSASIISFCALPFMVCIAYQALYAALWFACMNFLSLRFGMHHASIAYSVMWVIGMWFFFHAIEHISLHCFDRCEGYVLINPLLPLMEWSRLLYGVRYVPHYVMAFIVYFGSGLYARYLIYKDRFSFYGLIIVFLFWQINISMSYKNYYQTPDYLCRFVHIPKQFSCMTASLITARTVAEEVRQILERFPHADIVILPESSILDSAVFNENNCAVFFSTSYMQKSVYLCAGSFCNDGASYYNSLYCIHDSAVQRHDKRHAMLLTERIPSLCNYSCIRDIYFPHNARQITISLKDRTIFTIDKRLFVPYICSEIFFNSLPDDQHSAMPIMLVANDKWCPAAYARRLMFNAVRLKALSWKRDIIYVSYYYAVLCDLYGGVHYLQSHIYT